jgi:hypothetical protein
MMTHLWMLTCLLGWTALQATDVFVDFSEAHCKLKLVKEIPILVAQETYAFVYDDTAEEDPASDTKHKGASLVVSPFIFNSKGPTKKVAYARGVSTVPTAGNYQIVYSIYPFKNDAPHAVALAVNGKEIKATRVEIKKSGGLTNARFILKLAQGDHVSLILPDVPKTGTYLSLKPGINVSLLITKL